MSKTIDVNGIIVGGGNPLVLFAGPCVIENEKITLSTAEKINEITTRLNIPFIFKSSYKKANRTDVTSFTGLDKEEAFSILTKVRTELGLSVITDIHTPEEAAEAKDVADILQVPAFLCRQTDLLLAAGKTGRVVNIKKGQFLSPAEMKHAAEKVLSTGNDKILLTERGTTFGYQNLVVDMRGLKIMRELGFPVVMDATHSVQMPGTGSTTGGNPEFIEPLARAAVAVGIDALFLEVHPNPPEALSDAASQLHLNKLEDLLRKIKKLDETIRDL